MWSAHHDAVLAYARRRTGPDEARDVVAETFLVAWRRIDRAPEEPLPWLLGVARRTLANGRRAARRADGLAARIAAQPTAPAPDPAAVLGGGPLLGALATLREADREALLLVSWEDLSPHDAAIAAGCSQAAFRVRLHRARRRLAAAMNGAAP